MTQSDKDLLLKDLCSRLPYNVAIDCRSEDSRFTCYLTTDILREIQNNRCYWEYKPYLLPMSSMTKEQKKEYRKACDLDMTILENRPMKGEPFPAMYNSQDWLNANHFDYRGLIPMGLAIDATGKDIY